MFDWLAENWWALWLTVFLVFAVVEMLTLDLFFIMLGGGALAGLVAAFAGADFWLQIVVFSVVSLLMIGFVRPVALKHLRSSPADQRSNVERLIGESALVMEPVSANGGLVKIGGDIWSARSESGVLAPGQHAVVRAIDGATAVVDPQPNPQTNPLPEPGTQ
ncbi:NfeD family protein [Arthrobacter sp. C9C5]|uniref:NfeD family protein n=1 Tax=Arthrobacter sp. C9C5 TaxID=2735267 RepID=UPI0015845501|nr:NfeD family protein [Arthrobacter sp. C9C5]NUU32892.1 NfeD family protein [Arthrobacter sp. C9C5]